MKTNWIRFTLGGLLLIGTLVPELTPHAWSGQGGTDNAEGGALAQNSLVRSDSGASPCFSLLGVMNDSMLARRVLVLERPGDTLALSMAALAVTPYCLEGRGGFTTSAGSAITGTWAGVSLPDLLTEWGGIRDESSVTFIADDGYRMSFEGKDILDRRQGTWILAMVRDGEPIPAALGSVRAIRVGPSTPMVTGHTSVQGISRIALAGVPPQTHSLAMKGKMNVEVDWQTLQSCVSCHGVKVLTSSGDTPIEYRGVPLFRLLAYSDDSLYAPHRQDSVFPSYRADLAHSGYVVDIADDEGKTVSLGSRSLAGQDRAILALYRDGENSADDVAPVLVVALDADATQPPEPTILPRVRTVTLRLP
jgi:DMSO/TMAO reductase YedYZ molybdopterin-dependent catalytic subunit